MRRFPLLAFIGIALSGMANAEVALSIPLALSAADNVTLQTYVCENRAQITVQYVNAAKNSLAILPIDGEDRIFVNVVSASGAKYVSGTDVWWSSGNTATLINEIDDKGMLNCTLQ